jgi:peptidoglycan/LPS O-acetylase OafA/YrhL
VKGPHVIRDRPEIRALTGLRFLAALQVLVFHALFTFSRWSLRMPRGTLKTFLGSGYVGVNFFFVLSGFVLAYAYAGADAANATMTTSAARFWRSRFARIYPLHLLGLLLALAFFVIVSHANHAATPLIVTEGAKQFALSALLVQAWVPAHVLDLNGPSWSLSVEAFFYATFPLLLRLFGRLRAGGLVAVATLAWAAAVTPPLLHPGPASVLARTTDLDLVLLYNPIVRLPEFILGVATGLLFMRSAGGWKSAPVVATATLLLLLALLAEGDRLPFTLLHNGLLDPLWALLLFAVSKRSKDEGRERGIASPPLVRGGRASYALYVLHKPLYFWLTRLLGIGLLPSGPFLGAYVAGSVVLSLAARRYVEEPLRRRRLGSEGDKTERP